MGVSPLEIDKLSLWQFSAAWNGYVAAHSSDKPKMTERQVDEMFAWIDVGEPAADPQPLPAFTWTGRRLLSSPPR